ncbi:MAG: MATE family efflux transporter, partial [Ignavibacteriaceae bacterium]
SFLPCFGFGIAVQTLVGNNLGAGKYLLAKIYGFETAKVATIYTILLGMVFIIIPNYVLLIITTNQSIIEVAIPVLRIAGFAQIFYGIGIVLANGLQAAGRTVYVMNSEIITNLLLFVPLSYFLGVYLDLGLYWAWVALPFYIVSYSVIIFLKFNSKSWYKKIPVEN